MKTCFKCQLEKPLRDFYRHPQMSFGRLNKCKECTKTDVANYRAANLAKVLAYDRARGMLSHRVAARVAYSKTPRGKRALANGTARWAMLHPAKKAASTIVNNAVRDGRIVKLPCQVCGSTKHIHGHHDDYTKPLDVQWLCPKHHSELHKKLRNK